MSRYITLNHIEVQGANCVAGVTYGFPAITQFLGFVHALSRKLQTSKGVSLDACAVVCHDYQLLTYKPKVYSDYYFTQTKNPVAGKHESSKMGGSPSVIEEGKMNMSVSLVIEYNGFDGTEDDKKALEKYLHNLVLRHRLAGGRIVSLRSTILESVEEERDHKKILRRLIPGFVLKERTEYLLEHLEESNDKNALEAWLDFSSIKYKAESDLEKDENLSEKSKAIWNHVPKQKGGYLVPLVVGYQAISELYKAGEVNNARDATVPFCFVEAVYGVGEWISPHRIGGLDEILWRYSYSDDKYLCKQDVGKQSEDEESDDIDFNIFN